MNTIGDLTDIIQNTCSPKEIQLIEIAYRGTAKSLVSMKDRDLTVLGFKRLFLHTSLHYHKGLFLLVVSKSQLLPEPRLFRKRNSDVYQTPNNSWCPCWAQQCNLVTCFGVIESYFLKNFHCIKCWEYHSPCISNKVPTCLIWHSKTFVSWLSPSFQTLTLLRILMQINLPLLIHNTLFLSLWWLIFTAHLVWFGLSICLLSPLHVSSLRIGFSLPTVSHILPCIG